jgi:(4-O-methyl)-D-glucuronate---lignin esterase
MKMRFPMMMPRLIVPFRLAALVVIFLVGSGGLRLLCSPRSQSRDMGHPLLAAQATPTRPAPTPEQLAIQAASEKDHQRMMDLLGIKELRPGASGSANGPNPANYDESKADVYHNLPDPLVMKNGENVTSAQMWWSERRPEIVEDFDREILGRTPKNLPKVTWEVVSTTRETNGDVPVITKKLLGHVDNSSWPAIKVDIDLTLTTPANAAGPVPVIVEFGLSREFMAAMAKHFPQLAASGAGSQEPSWQQQVLARGWGYAELIPTSYQADNGAGLTQGIIGLMNKGQPRKLDDWGVLKAWAWGVSRAIDYFETDKAVDAKQIGLEGHSRYAKATLVAMAYEPRLAIAYVSSSGEGGAKLYRHIYGEQVGNVAGVSEYHWMAGNFLKYAGPLTPGDMPVDAHELIALCAPRPVFISGGATNMGDGWVDAKGMFFAAVGAGPVYRLLGKKDLGTPVFPPIETALINGAIAFRQHSGGHTPAPNWPTFLIFASRYLHAPAEKPTTEQLSEREAAIKDHQRMMDLLGIKELRPPASHDPKSPHAVNYDESMANPYPTLPDPLRLNDGKRVTSAKVWWTKRRPEIVEDFDRDVLGRVPTHVPKVTWEVVSTRQEAIGGVPVVTKRLNGHVDNSADPAIKVNIDMVLTTPANTAGPVPVIMELAFSPEFMAAIAKSIPEMVPGGPGDQGPSWQEQVLARGWGYAILLPTSFQADSGAGLDEGIIGLVNKGKPRSPDDWGTLRAWAWGASRAMDYLETDRAVDAKQVGIMGHSRFGKTALVAMAYDPRFAIAYISSAGTGGDKLYRHIYGEQLENLAAAPNFYYWMAGNFLKYAGPLTTADLPVDAHELIALCAPRPVFIGVGSNTAGDAWADPMGEFLGAVGAGSVYRLLGKKDLGTTKFPPMETALMQGDLAFRQHQFGHTPAPNWPYFLDFAARYLHGPGTREP